MSSVTSEGPPAVVQSHSDPFSQNTPLQRVCAAHGIVFQAYSSLGTQWWGQGYRRNPVLTAAPVVAAAERHGVTPGQVVLRWALNAGQAVVPRSSHPAHIAANLQLGFTLSEEENAAISALDGHLPAKDAGDVQHR